MARYQITPIFGDINQLPAIMYRGHLEDLQGVMRLIEANFIELYSGGVTSVAGVLVTDSAPGAGAITNYAPTSFGATSDRLDVAAHASNTTLNDLPAGFDGQRVRIRNTGSGILTLTNENSGSTAAKRFTGIGDVAVWPSDKVDIVYYAGSINRWTM